MEIHIGKQFNDIYIYTYAADDENVFFSFSFSLAGGLDAAGTGIGAATGESGCSRGVEATQTDGIRLLLIVVGCATKFGDGGIRGWGIDILFAVCTVGAEVVLILTCDTVGVFRGTAFTTICRPPIGLGDMVDVRGGGSVLFWDDTIGGWIRIEPILFTAVRPVGVCNLTCCYNTK